MQTDRTTKALVGIIVFLGLWLPQAGLALQETPTCAFTSIDVCRVQAEAGDASAQSSLGFAYGSGLGVPQDYTEAVRWYRMAAEKGDAGAQYSLGLMYANGAGVPEDDAEAVRWYRMAAEKGDARAQTNLGLMYANGAGVPEDDPEAVRWYRMAAEKGNARAQYSLGLMYANGVGVIQSFARAYLWFNLAAAASQGNERALNVQDRDRVAARLSLADRVTAQRLAAQCQASGFKDCGEPE